MGVTIQYDVRLQTYQIEWLRGSGNAADAIRQALAAHIKLRRGKKTPRGYGRACGAIVPDYDNEIKVRYSARLWLDQSEWLRSLERNVSEEIRLALDTYIVWRGMGFKTIVRHKLHKKRGERPSMVKHWTRLRPDQIERLRESGGNVSKTIRGALSMHMSHCNAPAGSAPEYVSAAEQYVPGDPGTIGFEVRLEPLQYKWLSTSTTPNGLYVAIDVYLWWRYLQR